MTDACCAPGRPHDPNVPTVPAADAVESTHSTPGTVPATLVRLPGGLFRMGDDSVWVYPGDGEGPVHEVECGRFAGRRVHGEQRPLRRVRRRHRPPHRRRAVRVVVRVRRASCPTTSPTRVPSQRAVVAAGVRRRLASSRRPALRPRRPRRPSRSSTCRGTTRRRTASGPARAFRPKPSGSTRRAAASSGTSFPWGDDLEPDGEHRMNVFQGTFPARQHRGRRVRSAPRRSTRSRRTASASTTSPATCGSGAPTGTTPRTTRGAPAEDPQGPERGTTRVMRGGSYLCHLSYCKRYRVSARSGSEPDSSTGNWASASSPTDDQSMIGAIPLPISTNPITSSSTAMTVELFCSSHERIVSSIGCARSPITL